MSTADRDFEGSPAKAFLREHWDLPIIQSLRAQTGRSLRYFGMPGPAIEDIRAWTSELEHVTAVELLRLRTEDEPADRERHRRLTHSLFQQGIDYQVLRGYVEDVLILGHDIDNQMPQYRTEENPAHARFSYDLVNLDFCGGAGYTSNRIKGRPKRVTALKQLFSRQQGKMFLLLLTLNVRDTIDAGLTKYLTDLGTRDPQLTRTLSWYAKCGGGMKKYRLKVAIPAFLQRVAEDECFEVYSYPPVAYAGTKATMVHFVLHCRPTSDTLNTYSTQRPSELIRMPLLECTGGLIEIADTQHEGFDWQYCYNYLGTLPAFLAGQVRAQAMGRLNGGAR